MFCFKKLNTQSEAHEKTIVEKIKAIMKSDQESIDTRTIQIIQDIMGLEYSEINPNQNLDKNKPIKFTKEIVEVLYDFLPIDKKYIFDENGDIWKLDSISAVRSALEELGYTLASRWYLWGTKPAERVEEITIERFIGNPNTYGKIDRRPIKITSTTSIAEIVQNAFSEFNVKFGKPQDYGLFINGYELASLAQLRELFQLYELSEESIFALRLGIAHPKEQNINVRQYITNKIESLMKLDKNELNDIGSSILEELKSLTNDDLKGTTYKNLRETLPKFKEKYINGNSFYEALLDYFVDYELMFLEYIAEVSTSERVSKKHYARWKNDESAQLFQRFFWAVVFDCQHPFTGEKIDLKDWLRFPLHHWKTFYGHENKYMNNFISLIAIPAEGNSQFEDPITGEISGDIGHNFMTQHIRNSRRLAALFDQEFMEIIASVLEGNAPEYWNLENKDMFERYFRQNRKIFEMIKLLLT